MGKSCALPVASCEGGQKVKRTRGGSDGLDPRKRKEVKERVRAGREARPTGNRKGYKRYKEQTHGRYDSAHGGKTLEQSS